MEEVSAYVDELVTGMVELCKETVKKLRKADMYSKRRFDERAEFVQKFQSGD